jgi:bacillithiol system protein YtxJ
MEWLPLINEGQLQELIRISEDKAVIIFKHSTRCSVSMMAKRNFEHSWKQGKESVPAYFLDLLAYRSVSDKVAHDLSVEHQSPQLIIVKGGKAIYTTSHDEIDARDVLEHITGA